MKAVSLLYYRALQEAQDIFGVDFDFDEFEQYGDDYGEDEEEEEEYEDDMIDEDGETRPRAAKKAKKRGKKATIYDVFEPSDLARAHYTDQDQDIRGADMPERFQLRQVGLCYLQSPS